MQLVAYGAQDIYLTGNPQITFFKVVYRRHTNFSMEDIVQDGAGNVEFGNEVNYTISRNGDLIHKMYFEIEPKLFAAKPIMVSSTTVPIWTEGDASTIVMGNRTISVKTVNHNGDPYTTNLVGYLPDDGFHNHYVNSGGTIHLYVIDTSATPVFEDEVGSNYEAQVQPTEHTTFIVTFSKSSGDLGNNMGTVFTMGSNPEGTNDLHCPPSFQVDQPYGSNVTPPKAAFLTVGHDQPNLMFDSFITIGGTPAMTNEIAQIGINFDNWTDDHELDNDPDGDIFYMNALSGPELTDSNTQIVLGQLTVPNDHSGREDSVYKFSGHLEGHGPTSETTWAGDFEIELPVVQEVIRTISSKPHKYCNNLGNSLLKEVEVEIGGQKIDKHYSHWLTTWNELTIPNDYGHKSILTKGGEPQSFGGGSSKINSSKDDSLSFNHRSPTDLDSATFLTPTKAYIPLQFWFNRNPGLALPLISLQYHEVKIKTKFEKYSNLVKVNDNSLVSEPLNSSIHSNVSFYVEYIYLDTDERRRFAQVSHEYLIEQLQFQKFTRSDIYELNLNHPVKELIWTGAPDQVAFSGPGTPKHLVINNDWQLKLNGHDRFKERRTAYFTRQQVYDHHSGYGGTTYRDSIAVYSFALKPEEHQPSGTCNFSRIDTAQLIKHSIINYREAINVYAVNYNVLRIMSGMGGLAYSN